MNPECSTFMDQNTLISLRPGKEKGHRFDAPQIG